MLDPHFQPVTNKDLLLTRLAMVGAYEQLPNIARVQQAADVIATAVDVFRKLGTFEGVGQSIIRSIALGIQPSHRHIMRRKIRRYARERVK